MDNNKESMPNSIVEELKRKVAENAEKGITIIEEAPKIEGDRNTIGDNNAGENEDIILKLLSIIEEKDRQINRLISVFETGTDRIEKMAEYINESRSKLNKMYKHILGSDHHE